MSNHACSEYTNNRVNSPVKSDPQAMDEELSEISWTKIIAVMYGYVKP